MSEQIEMFIWNNVSLFSNNYLEHRLPISELWGAERKRAAEAFEKVKRSYDVIHALSLGAGQEAELENKFIQPVLSALGYDYHVQPVTHRGHKKKRPDYALFRDSDSHEAASKERDEPRRFFSKALTILEAKYWGRRLNDADRSDILDSRDPTAQTLKYLEDVHLHTDGKINWAILTNGKQWRLFYYRAASRSGNYFEVDLEEVIRRGNLDDFLYFYLFFSRDAFIQDTATGKTWLDSHVEGSEAYAKAVSTRLKDLIFDEVFEGLARGFVHYRSSELGVKEETEKTRKAVFEGCLTVLYRLLFLLYAESRDLLPVKETGYFNNSLKKLKEDISKDLLRFGPEKMSKRSYTYWARLEGLFNIIAKGDSALNVPIYNGGLFETPFDSFLSKHKMPDPFLAEAIELLTVDQEGESTPGAAQFIDYSSLNVRHLGDIYEGLLEFHVQIAYEETVEVKEKGKLFWKRLLDIKKETKTYRRKAKGDVYIENSKHERKATGSYYTPHYIVEYIVKNTVGPVLDERFKKAGEILAELDGLYKKQRRQLKKPDDWMYWEHPGEPKGEHINEILRLENEVFDTLFDIKVLDPAMGSGHFLVHAVDFISDRMVTFLADYPDNPLIRRIEEMKKDILGEVGRQGVRIDAGKLTEVNLIKRTVMKRCIHGVDLNEMAVELAKLSLWLDSFTLGAPLSFLDHHLKCGNSLVGTNLEALEKATAGQLFAINLEPLKRAIRDILFVSSMSDATYQQVRDSVKKYNEADTSVAGYRMLLDIIVSEYFGTKDAKRFLLEQGTRIDLNNLNKSLAAMPTKDRKTIEAIETVAKEKRFFHWDIEFPEVFFDRIGEMEQKVEKKKNPGFDCVIGNPPYDVIAEKEQNIDLSSEKEFFNIAPFYIHAVGGKLNLYRLFSSLSLNLLHSNGFHGFIVPMAIMADAQAYPLRKFLLMENQITQIEAFPQKDDPDNRIFSDAKLSTCIYLVKKTFPKNPFIIRIHPGKEILESSLPIHISLKMIEALDSENLSLPSHPNINADDMLLALKLVKASNGAKLGDFASSQQGEVNLTSHVDFLSDNPVGVEVLRGAHVGRYEFHEKPKQGEPKYLNVTKFLEGKKPDSKAFDHKKLRIGYQRGSAIDNWRRIIATTIEPDNFCSDTINYIVEPRDLDIYTVLGLLNSKVLEWRFRLTSTNNHVNSYEVDAFPIPHFSFATPEEERKKAVERLEALYSSGKGDRIITEVEGYLPEKSDVVHDVLTFFAKQMIEMNKAKNEEVEGFLSWLEREVGAEIENLVNKTAIKEYHKYDFIGLLEILKKNKGKLSIDPSSRKNQELIEAHFNESTSKIEPLKAGIKATDELIDEIVYRLYGLTKDEISIVKGEA